MTGRDDRHSAPAIADPFSRLLVVDDVTDAGLSRAIEADPAECAAVAAEIGLPSLHKLQARYECAWQPGRRLHVEGVVEASITQICVVSLDPFDSDVTQAVDIVFAGSEMPDAGLNRRVAAASRRRTRGREVAEPAAPPPVQVTEGEVDPPDPIVDGRVDLGAVSVEFLTLALDFYPRKPGVHFSDVVVGDRGDEDHSAFAALARLKDPS